MKKPIMLVGVGALAGLAVAQFGNPVPEAVADAAGSPAQTAQEAGRKTYDARQVATVLFTHDLGLHHLDLNISTIHDVVTTAIEPDPQTRGAHGRGSHVDSATPCSEVHGYPDDVDAHGASRVQFRPPRGLALRSGA